MTIWREKIHRLGFHVFERFDDRFPAITHAIRSLNPNIWMWIAWPYVDMAGYHRFIPSLERSGIFDLPGDILEIGSFIGVGTAKLAAVARRRGKKVFAVDIFQPMADNTTCTTGRSMSSLYSEILRGMDQREVYELNTEPFVKSIITLRGDSKNISLPKDARFCLAFIDGDHDPSYVRNDFWMAWSRLVEGGVVGFDDYGHDLPQVTATVDELISENKLEIEDVWTMAPKFIFIRKSPRTTRKQLPNGRHPMVGEPRPLMP